MPSCPQEGICRDFIGFIWFFLKDSIVEFSVTYPSLKRDFPQVWSVAPPHPGSIQKHILVFAFTPFLLRQHVLNSNEEKSGDSDGGPSSPDIVGGKQVRLLP